MPWRAGNVSVQCVCHIADALATSHGGPDKVIAVRSTGIPYRETGTGPIQIAPGDSGTVGHPFVLFARGSVVIDAANATSTWTQVPGTGNETRWRTGVTGVTDVTQVFLDGVTYPYVEKKPLGSLADLPPGQCMFKEAGMIDSLYVNFGAQLPLYPVTVNPTGITGYWTMRGGIDIGAPNVTVQGFTIRRAKADGVHISRVAARSGLQRNVTIADCDIRGSFDQGIMADTFLVHDCTIRNNVASLNGSHGIYLPDSNTTFSVLNNTCDSNLKVLAYLDSPPGRSSVNGIRLGNRGKPLQTPFLQHNHVVEGNVAHYNQDTGIEIRTNYTTRGTNQSWGNQDHGFDHLYCTNVSHIGDLSWGNNRDGMSFEDGSNNITLSNCVIANNGRDPCRKDWELEILGSALTGFSSDCNVIWRDASEPGDNVLVNLQVGLDGSACGNSNCSNPDSCFTTLAAYNAKFPGLEAHSKAGQPLFADGNGGNFIPLSNSPVVDAANSGAIGYVSTDVRGYLRHDTQVQEPNTGTGAINYADIGPFEFDATETPTAPTIQANSGLTTITVSWPSSQFNGDESSQYQVFVDNTLLISGPALPPPEVYCFQATGLVFCMNHQVYVKMVDVNTGLSSTSNIVNIATKCSGGEVGCTFRPLAGGNDVTAGDDEGDQPLSLTLRAGSGGSREIAYAIPRSLAGSPIDLGVFDVAGRRVLTIVRGPGRAGRFVVPIAGGRLRGAGVYFVRLRTGGETLRKTAILW